jgi:hypothetical protein
MAISKRTVYTLFILKFFFSIALIFWTIKITLGAGVGQDDDNSFLSDYKNVNENYNKIVRQNEIFNNKYSITLIINNKQLDNLSYDDLFLSQRNIKDRSERKNILKQDTNNLILIVKNKQTKQIVKDVEATITITKPSSHDGDVTFNINKSNKNIKFILKDKSYWNIMGLVKINNDQGHFYIKTNSR